MMNEDGSANNTDAPRSAEQKRHKHNYSVLTVAAYVIAGLAIVALIVGLIMAAMGKLPGGEGRASSYEIVCGSDIVERFNTRNPAIPDGTGDAVFTQIRDDIVAMNDYADDPTCQTILFMFAWGQADTDGMTTAADKLVDLNSQNVFSNNNLSGTFSVDTMASIAQAQQNIDSSTDNSADNAPEGDNPDEAE
jgi:hypothetical protein